VILWGENMLISLERLHGRKSLEFNFDSPGNDDYLIELGAKYLRTLKVWGLVERSGNFYLANGRVTTGINLQCSRCLKNIYYPLSVEFKVNIANLRFKEELPQDEDVLLVEHDEVELKPYIEELIFSEIPFVPLCSPECQGICPKCGINKNNAQCNCSQQNTDPRWDKLKDLELGKEVT
jgi:uncharacterized protein